MSDALTLLFVMAFPAVVLRFSAFWRRTKVLSPVIVCFLTGIILGNLKLVEMREEMFSPLASLSILLALPLLLASTDVKAWMSGSVKTMTAMLAACMGVGAAMATCQFIIGRGVDEVPEVLAMVTGSLTGSTINLNAVGLAVGASPELLAMVAVGDIVAGGLFFLYLITFGPKIYGWVLKNEPNSHEGGNIRFSPADTSIWHQMLEVGKGLGRAAIISGVSVGLVYLFIGAMREDLILIALTMLSLMAVVVFPDSFRYKSHEGTADYLLLVFSLSVGLKANFGLLLQKGSEVIWWILGGYLLTAVFQLVFYRWLRVSAPLAMMATTGTVFGPAFVGQVAFSTGSRNMVVKGMLIAIAGYAIGNMAGLMVWQLLN